MQSWFFQFFPETTLLRCFILRSSSPFNGEPTFSMWIQSSHAIANRAVSVRHAPGLRPPLTVPALSETLLDVDFGFLTAFSGAADCIPFPFFIYSTYPSCNVSVACLLGTLLHIQVFTLDFSHSWRRDPRSPPKVRREALP